MRPYGWRGGYLADNHDKFTPRWAMARDEIADGVFVYYDPCCGCCDCWDEDDIWLPWHADEAGNDIRDAAKRLPWLSVTLG